MKRVVKSFVKIVLVLLSVKLLTYVWGASCTFDSSLVYALSLVAMAVIVYIMLGVKLPKYDKEIHAYKKK